MGFVSSPTATGSLSKAARGWRDRVFLLGAVASFVGLALVSEATCRWLVARGLLYELDVAGVLTTLPELEDRIRWGLRAPRSIFVVGDSVLGATALLQHDEKDARKKALPSALQELRRERVVSLGADGLVPLDLLAISRTISRISRECDAHPRVILVLNFRMFARELQPADERLSRSFLAPALSDSKHVPDDRFSLDERALSSRLFSGASRHVMLFRTTQLLRTVWYFPTQHDRFQRAVESALGKPPIGDAEEAALRMRVLPFYREPVKAASPPVASVSATLAALRRDDLLVVLSPQNPDFVSEAAEAVAASRAVLSDVVSRAGASYLDLSDRFGAALFLDHCHLTAPGNRRLARFLHEALPG